jgi:RNA polymerase sigma-70 factor (ECF subfamily)
MKKKEFIRLYDEFAPRIHRFINLKINSIHDSEDLTSETFFKFWQKSRENRLNDIKIDYPKAMLYRIANNLVIDFYRKKSKKEISLDPEDKTMAKIKDRVDLVVKSNLDSDMEQIKTALAQMKEEHQNVIVWRYLDELSTKEIAEILGKSEGAARVLIHRALNALKENFRK